MLTRNGDGTWTLQEATQGSLPIPPLQIELSIADVYAGFDALAGA